MSYLTIPITSENGDKIKRIIDILLEPEPESEPELVTEPLPELELSTEPLSVLDQDSNYYHVNDYRIRKPGLNCGEVGRVQIEWFLKKVTETPELMLNCLYCKKTFWKKTEDSPPTSRYLKHQERCKIKKKNKLYQDNIRVRS